MQLLTLAVFLLAGLAAVIAGVLIQEQRIDETHDRLTREQLDRRNREYFDRMPLISANNKQEE